MIELAREEIREEKSLFRARRKLAASVGGFFHFKPTMICRLLADIPTARPRH